MRIESHYEFDESRLSKYYVVHNDENIKISRDEYYDLITIWARADMDVNKAASLLEQRFRELQKKIGEQI